MTHQQLELDGTCTSDGVALVHAKRQRKALKESPEDLFEFQCRAHKLPAFTRQAMFAKQALGRRWMFDFAWQPYMLAVEIEGLAVRVLPNPARKKGRELIVSGRHATVDGIQEDMVKYNSAVLLGWSVLRFSQKMVTSKEAIAVTMRVLAARGWQAG